MPSKLVCMLVKVFKRRRSCIFLLLFVFRLSNVSNINPDLEWEGMDKVVLCRPF